jgi:hypothetical protein
LCSVTTAMTKTQALAGECDGRLSNYLRALLFLLPPVAIWLLVQTKCVPILLAVAENQGLRSGSAAPLLSFSLFVAQYGLLILTILVLGLSSLEFSVAAFADHRRLVVGSLVWLVNGIVLCGLAALFTAAMITLPAGVH